MLNEVATVQTFPLLLCSYFSASNQKDNKMSSTRLSILQIAKYAYIIHLVRIKFCHQS